MSSETFSNVYAVRAQPSRLVFISYGNILRIYKRGTLKKF